VKATLYSASWCGPCGLLKAELRKKENADVKALIRVVDVDSKAGGAESDRMKVTAMPTLIREDGKRRIGVYTGKSLRKWLGGES
jgi:hypothetical protein